MRITKPLNRVHEHWEPVHTRMHLQRGGTVALSCWDASDAGPTFMGMDPSDPLTWVRPWSPQPGMIAYLNFDGARLQERTPTGGVQRGSQRRGARGSR